MIFPNSFTFEAIDVIPCRIDIIQYLAEILDGAGGAETHSDE